jgi:hypothetical protein
MPFPRKLTPEVHRQIVKALREGAFREAAAKAAGIRPTTLTEWVQRGEKADPDDETERSYAVFAADVSRAEGEVEIEQTKKLLKATSRGDAKGIAIWLERRFRARWGSHRTLELTGAGGGPVQHGVVVLPAQIPNGSTMTACLMVEGREIPRLPPAESGGESGGDADEREDLGDS